MKLGHILVIKEILVEARVKRATSKKIQFSKVMVCFRNNIAPFLANEKCFRSRLRCIFESHWINEFFNKVVYCGGNRNKLHLRPRRMIVI